MVAAPRSRANAAPGLRVGDRLPPLVLPRAEDGAGVAWRAPQRGEPIVVFLVAPDEGRAYLSELAAAGAELRAWYGRPLAVLPAGAEPAEFLPAGTADGVTVLTDPEGEARRRCGVGAGSAALFIADRWGQIYFIAHAATEEDLPRPEAIEEWVRFLATQCPECGVPDEPARGGREA